jgi:hypothetical protein
MNRLLNQAGSTYTNPRRTAASNKQIKNGVIRMQTISNRYVIEDCIIELNGGLLHTGQDLSLNRIVFIYKIPNQGKSFREKYPVNLGNSVEKSTHSQFTQVLDGVFDEDYIYVILKYQEGRSMAHVIRQNDFVFADAAAIVADLSETLQVVAEERAIDFSLAPNNLWLGEDQKISIINSWEKVGSGHPAARDLSELLFAVLTRRETIPAEPELFAAELHRVLQELPAEQQEQIITGMANSRKKRLSLALFSQCVNDLLHDAHPAQHQPAMIVRQAVEQPPARVQQAEQSPARPMVGRQWERTAGRNFVPAPRPAKKLIKSAFAAVSLGLLSLAVFLGVFATLITLRGHKTDVESSTVAMKSDSQTEARANSQSNSVQVNPKTEVKQITSQEATAAVLPQADTNGIAVPSLTGLTKEAAEKQAVSSGLHYTFYFEPSNDSSGTVFKQEPAPNAPAEKGSHVTFWVSKGNKF